VIAERIGVSECELVASRVGQGVIRLTPRWQPLLEALARLGPVYSVTRNRGGVIEKKGEYPPLERQGAYCVFASPAIHLRLSLACWGSAFAVEWPAPGIQFFARNGEEVHHVYLTRKSRSSEFAAICREFADADQSQRQPVEPDFGRRASRLDAYAVAEGQFTRAVEPASGRRLLQNAARKGMLLTILFGNPGCVQIHRGAIQQVVSCNGWLNVLDPGVELSFEESMVASAWVVRKPARSGAAHVTLELFDAEGREIVSFAPWLDLTGRPSPDWPEAIADLR
jgi:putative hemin transport protein